MKTAELWTCIEEC